MKRCWKLSWVPLRAACVGGLMVVGLWLSSVGTAAETADDGAAPSEFAADPAFDRYVDLQAFSTAIVAGDAAAATDGVLQLAEGERVLCREHVAISADQAFGMALQAAIGSRDAATVGRLEKAAEQLGRKAWATRLAAAKALLSASRAAEPVVDFAELGPEGIELARSVQKAMQLAKLTGDKALLAEVLADVKASEIVPEAQKGQLIALIEHASKNLPAEPNAAAAAILPQIIGTSRGSSSAPCPPGTIAISVDGGTPVGSTSGAAVVVTNGLREPVYLPGQVAISNGRDFGVRSSAGSVRIWATRWVRRRITAGGTSFYYYDAFPIKNVQVSIGFSLTGGAAKVAL